VKQHHHPHPGKHQGHTKKHTKKHTGQHQPPPHRKGHKGPAVTPGPLVVPVPSPQHHRKRGLALGEAVPCCSAEALAASLRLAGWPVGEADVLALHEAAGGSRDAGVSIEAALETAARVGLAGCRPRSFEPFDIEEVADGATTASTTAHQLGYPDPLLAGDRSHDHLWDRGCSLILGADLPGPHALTADDGGVWSWGEWHPWSCFAAAAAEEAWSVTWAPQGGV
jgi:hypothetical protein